VNASPSPKTPTQKLAAMREALAEEPAPSSAPPVLAESTKLNLEVFFLGGLFTIALLASLRVASAVVLPTVLAFVLKLLLQPAVQLLERVRIDRRIGAILVMVGAGGVIAGLVMALSVPMASWTKRLPEVIPRV
jgi:predicted PurR-regulated permease PerM